MKKEVNAIGDICPIPLVKAKEAIKELNGAGVVEVLVDNEIAVQNLTQNGAAKKDMAVHLKGKDQEYRVTLTVGEKDEQTTQKPDSETAKSTEECIPCAPTKKTSLVVISSKTMGGPNEQLGATLLKGFIYALTQQDELPDQMLFYNGGAIFNVRGFRIIRRSEKFRSTGGRDSHMWYMSEFLWTDRKSFRLEKLQICMI